MGSSMNTEGLIIDMRKNVSHYHYLKSYLNYIIHDAKFINQVRKMFKNSLNVSIRIFQNKYPIVAELKDGNKLSFENFHHLYSHLLNLDYNIVDETVLINDVLFYDGINNAENLYEIYFKNEYGFLNVHDKIVLDVGANIADTSIYFAKQGASKVISIEPDKRSFDTAVKNIQKNNMGPDIELLPFGCGNERVIPDEQKTKIISLETLMGLYSYKPAILKLDCEGCEYETILKSSSKLLSNFSQIQIEYHYGYKNLKSKLEDSGFKVSVTEPRYFRIRQRGKQTENNVKFYDQIRRKDNVFLVGWIYANNINKLDS